MAAILGALAFASIARTYDREVDEILTLEANALAAAISPERDGSYDIELTSDQVDRFQEDASGTPYYCIWNASGVVIDSSDPNRSFEFPAANTARSINGHREVSVDGPAYTRVLVGRSTDPERAQLRSLAIKGGAITVAGLIVMLIGGWLLTNKALEPIERISNAAASISDSNLTERIDVSRMESELAGLSLTINDAFDRLQAAFNRQTQFTADASHELRTPLSVVTTHADYALKRPRTVEEYQESLQAIKRAAARMRGVVEGLLTLARADASELPFELTPVDLETVINESIALLRPLAQQKGIAVSTALTQASVLADRNLMHEVVANLVTNAINYNRDDGRVDIGLKSEGEDVVLRVRDTGIGIPKAEQHLIFDRFFQSDSNRSRANGDGTGLGLAITKWIVDAHGGDISFSSEEGVGTEFVVRLRRCDRSTNESTPIRAQV